MTFLKKRFQKQLVHSNVICLKHAENRREDESMDEVGHFYDNVDENEEEEEEPNKKEIDAKRKIFEKRQKKKFNKNLLTKLAFVLII